MNKEKKQKMIDLMTTLGIEEKTIKEVIKNVKIEELKGNHKKYFDKYKQNIKVKDDELQGMEEEQKQELNKIIEDELLYVECFLRWLQEEENVKLVKK